MLGCEVLCSNCPIWLNTGSMQEGLLNSWILVCSLFLLKMIMGCELQDCWKRYDKQHAWEIWNIREHNILVWYFCYITCKKWQMFFSNLWIIFGTFPACASIWSYRWSWCSSKFVCGRVHNCDVQGDFIVVCVNSNYRMRHILINLKVLCHNIEWSGCAGTWMGHRLSDGFTAHVKPL